MFPVNSCYFSASNNMENSSVVNRSLTGCVPPQIMWQAYFPLNFWNQIYFIYVVENDVVVFSKACILSLLRKCSKITSVYLLPVFEGSQKCPSWWLHEARAAWRTRAAFWQDQAPALWKTSGKGFSAWLWLLCLDPEKTNVGIFISKNIHDTDLHKCVLREWPGTIFAFLVSKEKECEVRTQLNYGQGYWIKRTDDSAVHSYFLTAQVLFQSVPLGSQSGFSLGFVLPV